MIEEEEVIEFFGRLISEQKTRKIPVVVLDGNIVSPSIRQQIAELNAVHVNKPFSQEELIDAIKSAIDHRKK
jgi:CheY-like chemotaxis protein